MIMCITKQSESDIASNKDKDQSGHAYILVKNICCAPTEKLAFQEVAVIGSTVIPV